MNVTDVLALALKLIEILEPTIASVVKDWSDGKITAEEADAAAEGKFSRMALALADPQAETDVMDAATEVALAKKFAAPVAPAATRLGDKEEPNFVELKDARAIVPLADLAAINPSNDEGKK